jgi:DNA-binding response OmpR family regulator
MVEQERAMLLMRQGSAIDQRWPLDRPNLTMGRGPDNDLVFPDREISRHHCRIRRVGRQYILEDLNSRNGTLINGEAITEPRALRDGDEIQIAPRFRLTFVDIEATAPLARAGQSVELRLDSTRRAVYIRGQEMSPQLSPAQFAFLELLARDPGRVYDRSEVIAAVWPNDDETGISDQAIDALVRRLRERLAEFDPHNQYVVTVRGHGFRLGSPG